MRFIQLFLAIILLIPANIASAQQSSTNSDAAQQVQNTNDCENNKDDDCGAAPLPADEVVNLPTGDVQNIFFAIGPILGAAGAVALAAGGGGGGNSTTSTTAN